MSTTCNALAFGVRQVNRRSGGSTPRFNEIKDLFDNNHSWPHASKVCGFVDDSEKTELRPCGNGVRVDI